MANLTEFARERYAQAALRARPARTWLRRGWSETVIELMIRLAGVSTIAIVGLIFLFLVFCNF